MLIKKRKSKRLHVSAKLLQRPSVGLVQLSAIRRKHLLYLGHTLIDPVVNSPFYAKPNPSLPSFIASKSFFCISLNDE